MLNLFIAAFIYLVIFIILHKYTEKPLTKNSSLNDNIQESHRKNSQQSSNSILEEEQIYLKKKQEF
jgi:hypothetical protein